MTLLRCPACDGVLDSLAEEVEPSFRCQSCGRLFGGHPASGQQSTKQQPLRVVEIDLPDIARKVHRAVKQSRGVRDPLLRLYLASYLLIVTVGSLIVLKVVVDGHPEMAFPLFLNFLLGGIPAAVLVSFPVSLLLNNSPGKGDPSEITVNEELARRAAEGDRSGDDPNRLRRERATIAFLVVFALVFLAGLSSVIDDAMAGDIGLALWRSLLVILIGLSLGWVAARIYPDMFTDKPRRSGLLDKSTEQATPNTATKRLPATPSNDITTTGQQHSPESIQPVVKAPLPPGLENGINKAEGRK